MTERNHTGGCSAATPGSAELPKFFKLNADYMIDPEAEISGLGTDIGCMSEALIATIHAMVDATSGDDHQFDGLLFGALYQAKQVAGMSAEYVRRTAQPAGPSAPEEAKETAPPQAPSSSSATEMAQSISDATCAANAVRAALDEIQEAVYSEFGSAEQGLYEAAVASTERLDRALERGIEAGSVYSPVRPGRVQ